MNKEDCQPGKAVIARHHHLPAGLEPFKPYLILKTADCPNSSGFVICINGGFSYDPAYFLPIVSESIQEALECEKLVRTLYE